MARPFLTLVYEARRQLAYTNRAFAELTGVSLRTVERHAHNGGIANHIQTRTLVTALHPKDPALAAELAESAGTTLAALGLEAPQTEPDASLVRPEHADSVLVAAANALDLSPEAVRPAVAAAFSRALALGVSFAGLAEQLSRPGPKTGKARKAASPS